MQQLLLRSLQRFFILLTTFPFPLPPPLSLSPPLGLQAAFFFEKKKRWHVFIGPLSSWRTLVSTEGRSPFQETAVGLLWRNLQRKTFDTPWKCQVVDSLPLCDKNEEQSHTNEMNGGYTYAIKSQFVVFNRRSSQTNSITSLDYLHPLRMEFWNGNRCSTFFLRVYQNKIIRKWELIQCDDY